MPDASTALKLKERILEIVKSRGPSLPVHISNQVNVEPLFVSAFLSELKADNKISISNMRVGSSPLYYVPGQEAQLENFIQYLNQREKEALELIKKEKVLLDKDQTPVIRVALREIKDFAIPAKININGEEIILWRHFSLTDSEFNEKANKLVFGEEIQKTETKHKAEHKMESEPNKEPLTEEKEPEEQKEIKPKQKAKKEKIYIESEFAKKLKSYLKEKNAEIVETIIEKSKEIELKVKINTIFGNQEFYLIAKDKKKIPDTDLALLHQRSQQHKMPAILSSTGDLSTKAKEYLKEWSNLLRYEKLKF